MIVNPDKLCIEALRRLYHTDDAKRVRKWLQECLSATDQRLRIEEKDKVLHQQQGAAQDIDKILEIMENVMKQ